MNKTIKENFIFSILKTLTTIIFPLITFPYASRILGPANLGKVQYCSSIISYFILIATLGINIYGVREGSKYKNNRNELNKFFKEILLINTISMIISYLLLFIYIILFFKEPYIILLLISSLLIFFQSYSIEWLYQLKEDYVYISLRAIIMNIISLILLFVFVKDKNDFILYGAINVISVGGSFVFNVLNSRKHIDYRQKTKLELRRHIRPILIIFSISAASSIYLNLDNVMLGSIIGTTAVGLYSVAVKLQHVIKNIISAITNVLFSRLSHYIGNNKKNDYMYLFNKGIHLIIMLIIPISIGMFIVSREIVYLFGGEKYIVVDYATKILSINLFFSVINGLLYYQVLLPFGKEKEAAISTIIGAFSNIILNFLFIPKYSYLGAAFTTLVSEIIVFINLFRYSRKCIKIDFIFNYIGKFLLLSIPMIIYCMIINRYISNSIINLIINVIGGGFIYITLLLMSNDCLIVDIKNKLIKK